jgi:AraC-like DNA-binding protein
MDYVQINGILLYRDRWSRRILATGATPSGYFFFGGPTSPKLEASWCGTELSPKCLAFGRPSSEVDFATPEVEEHICLLVPVHLMLRYLGEETAMRVLPDARVLSCATACGTQLLKMMERILDKYLLCADLLADARACQAIEWQLMGAMVEFLLFRRDPGDVACASRAARHSLVRRAIEICEAASAPISVSDLATACSVSKRVLELGFQETVRSTPSRFIRQSRMNRVRRELSVSDPASDRVTDVLSRFGVSELGRFAVEYKSLFGESPSGTLRRSIALPDRRLEDVL